jgi:hypothetical protein
MDTLNRSAIVVKPKQPLWTGFTSLIPAAVKSTCPTCRSSHHLYRPRM